MGGRPRATIPPENITLIGEDRTYGDNLLYIDMIPNTMWYNNVRTCVRAGSWDKIRKHVYERVNHKCECCDTDCTRGGHYQGDDFDTEKAEPIYDNFDGDKEFEKWNTIRIEAHERWSFDKVKHVQKLERLVALCHRCHTATHMGLAGIRGLKSHALAHIQKVNGWSREKVITHSIEQRVNYKERGKEKWNINIDIITKSGFNLLSEKQMSKNLLDECSVVPML
jgi:hypothetical protein